MNDSRSAGLGSVRTLRVALSLLPVLLITLIPVGSSVSPLEAALRVCRACGSHEASDGFLNFLLFIPFGWVIGRRLGVLKAFGWGLVISVGIEGAQIFIPGRFASAADLLANSFGTGFGAWVSTRTRLPIRVFALGALGAVFSPAVLLLPAFPAEGVYYGQWTASFGGMEVYGGQVLDARIGEILVPPWRSDRTDEIRKALNAGALLRIRLEAGPPPQGQAPLFSIFDDFQQEVLMLGADGDDIFLRFWRLGTTARFQTPTLWWEDALQGVPVGDTTLITYALSDRGPCLTVEGRTHCLTASMDLGGWSLLAPDGQGRPTVTVVGFLWAFLLGAPFGMLSLTFRGKVFLASALGIGVAAVSLALPYWVTPWWGMLLMFTGMGAASLMEPWIRKTLEA